MGSNQSTNNTIKLLPDKIKSFRKNKISLTGNESYPSLYKFIESGYTRIEKDGIGLSFTVIPKKDGYKLTFTYNIINMINEMFLYHNENMNNQPYPKILFRYFSRIY